MKKKIASMLIGTLSTIILSYGFVAYADHNSSATTEDKTTSASDTYVVPSKTDAAADKPAAAQPSANEEPTIMVDQLKALEIKIDGNDVKVKIELEREQAKIESKVEINRGEDQKIYLTGSEAAQFIQQLLAAIKLQANMNKQQVLDALFKHFAVQPAKVELKIDIKMMNRPDELKYKHEKEDDDVNAKVQSDQTAQDNQEAQLTKNGQLSQKELKEATIAKKKALQRAWQKAHKEQQAKKKQQKQLVRGDRDDDHHNGKQDDNDDHDEDHDHDGDHGEHQNHDHEEHDNED